MKPSITLPEIHERYKKQSLSQRWEPGTSSIQQVTHRKSQKKEEQYRLIEAKLDGHKQELERNAAVIKQLTDNFDLVKNELMNEQASNQQLREAVKRYREEIDRLNKQLRGSKGRCDQLQKQLVREQEERRALDSAKDLQSKALTEQSKKLNKLQTENAALKKNAASLKETIAQLTQQVEKGRKDRDIFEQESMRKLEQERSKLVLQLEGSKRQLSEVQARLSVLEGRNGVQSKQVAELQSRIAKLNDAVEARESQLAVRANELKLLQEGRRQIQAELATVRREVEERDARLAAVQAQQLQLAGNHQRAEQKLHQSETTSASLRTQLTKVTQDLTSTKDELKRYVPSHMRLQQLTKQVGKLQQSRKQLQGSVSCAYCNSQLKQPVTIIPCGHCFCLGCKKGYQKQCCRCGPKVKIDALYRNQLMDEVLEVLKVVGSLATILNGVKESLD